MKQLNQKSWTLQYHSTAYQLTNASLSWLILVEPLMSPAYISQLPAKPEARELSKFLLLCGPEIVAREISGSNFPDTGWEWGGSCHTFRNEFSKAHTGTWMVFWGVELYFLGCIAPYTSLEKGSSGTPVESKVGPVTKFSVLWWSWVPCSMRLKSISLLCGSHMAMSYVDRIRACSSSRQGSGWIAVGVG